MWSDLREKLESIHDEHLSNNKLAVNNVKLSFDFPYYGHMVTNATLTTGGNKTCTTTCSIQLHTVKGSNDFIEDIQKNKKVVSFRFR